MSPLLGIYQKVYKGTFQLLKPFKDFFRVLQLGLIPECDVETPDPNVQLQDTLGHPVRVGQAKGLLKLELHQVGQKPVLDFHPSVQGSFRGIRNGGRADNFNLRRLVRVLDDSGRARAETRGFEGGGRFETGLVFRAIKPATRYQV